MANQKYAEEFREEAVRQVLDRGYSVNGVSEKLGVSKHSLYKRLKAVRPSPEKRREEELLEVKRENLKLRAELRRTQEERDISKKPQWVLRVGAQAAVRPRRQRPAAARGDSLIMGRQRRD